jgi:UDPglucose 6-dehydrogenase
MEDNIMKKEISVIGIGKLGICFALTLERAGYDVLGVDISPEYVRMINDKTLRSDEENVENYLKTSTNFTATTDLQRSLEHSDVLFVIVATPSLENGRYDHSQIDSLLDKFESFGIQQSPKQLIICCTTMPGYCDTVAERMAEYNYVVSYNPEFIAQGTILRDQEYPEMVLIGEGSTEAGDTLQEIYEIHTQSSPRICRMSRKEAEICKISLNCFLTTKISFANMIGDIVLRSGFAPNAVLEAIGSDTRVGNRYLNYGYGYGGPCFPRDNRALALYAEDVGIDALISIASDQSNQKHLEYQIERFVADSDPEDAQVIVDSVTYKPESTMIVESQQLAYAVGLAKAGCSVTIRERASVIDEVSKIYGNLFTYEEMV